MCVGMSAIGNEERAIHMIFCQNTQITNIHVGEGEFWKETSFIQKQITSIPLTGMTSLGQQNTQDHTTNKLFSFSSSVKHVAPTVRLCSSYAYK